MINKGFTLVELLLVIALLTISIGVTSDVLLSLVRSYNKTQVANEIEQQANFVSLKLEKELRNAMSARMSGNDLVITDRESNDIVYSLSGVILKRNDIELTDDGTVGGGPTRVGGVSVICSGPCFATSGVNPIIVRISMRFEQAGTDLGKSFTGDIDIDNAIVIRSTY